MLLLQHYIAHKVWFSMATLTLVPAKLVERLKNTLTGHIPEGYQDETGFHFGSELRSK
jgi:hypothetical protein